MLGGTGIVATAPVTAARIPFLASVAMALPTRCERSWKTTYASPTSTSKIHSETCMRVKHTYLNRSTPESTVAFATKYVDGAVGRSGKKIKVNGLATIEVGTDLQQAQIQVLD
jgi:hypothetical protein